MTTIVAYAPTNVADEDIKDAFFNQLHQAVSQTPSHDIAIILTKPYTAMIDPPALQWTQPLPTQLQMTTATASSYFATKTSPTTPQQTTSLPSVYS